MNNPLDLLKQGLSHLNPKQVVLNMIGNNTNPMIQNLVEMAKNNNTKGVEEFARNYMKGQGKDFDKEIANFQKMFK